MKNIAIFASGSGTNAENITKIFADGNRIRTAVMVCNRKEAGVYRRMEALGVPTLYFPNDVWENNPAQIIDALATYDIDLVVLAGFMRRIHPDIIARYPRRIINIHPSLLPAYGGKGMYGHHVHEAVLAAGETKSGVTVHYVTEQIDGGDIIMQQEVPLTPDDTPQTLEAKIHPVEYDLYPRAIAKVVRELEESQSVDKAWADVLHLNYSDEVAAQRASAAATSAPVAPPPAPAAKSTVKASATPTQAHPSDSVQAPADSAEGKPKSYLWLSIIMAALFATIPGVVAIIFSAITKSKVARGDLAGAVRASRIAQIWIIVAFVLGLLTYTVWYPISIAKDIFL